MGYFNADGASVAEYDYGPFGEPVKATGPKAHEFSFRFSTKYQDEQTGQLYYGYRLYDPPSGKWTSRDPISEEPKASEYKNQKIAIAVSEVSADLLDGSSVLLDVIAREKSLQVEIEWIEEIANLYRFNINAPLNFVDPFGLDVYLTSGNRHVPSWKIGNRALHQEVCVDTKAGKRCFSYMAVGLGWGYIKGEVYETPNSGGGVVDSFCTTPEQDEQALEILLSTVGEQGGYGCRANCPSYAQAMFDLLKQNFYPGQ